MFKTRCDISVGTKEGYLKFQRGYPSLYLMEKSNHGYKNREKLLSCWRRTSARYYLRHKKEIIAKRKAVYKYRPRSGVRRRFKILSKFGFTCQYCGRKAPEVILHIDHIIPRSKGGSNNSENLTVACMDCNFGKSNLIIS